MHILVIILIIWISLGFIGFLRKLSEIFSVGILNVIIMLPIFLILGPFSFVFEISL